MRIKKDNSKCSSCGGSLVFDAKTQSLFCNNCNRFVEIEKTHSIDKTDYTKTNTELNNKKKTTNCYQENV